MKGDPRALVQALVEAENVVDTLNHRLDALRRSADFLLACLTCPEGASDWFEHHRMGEPTQWGDTPVAALLALVVREMDSRVRAASLEIKEHTAARKGAA